MPRADSTDVLVLAPAEAAAQLLTKPRTLERWRTNGTGPKYVRIGRRVAYRPADLAAFVASQVRTHTGEKLTVHDSAPTRVNGQGR